MDHARKVFVSYVYHDFLDSAQNFKYFIDNFKFKNTEILVGANTFNYFDIKKIPNKYRINIAKYETDLEFHFEALEQINCNYYDLVMLLNSSCIGPICPTYVGDLWLDKILQLTLQHNAGIVAPVIEVPPDQNGSAVYEEKYIKYLKDNNLNIPFAHTYCLFLSPAAATALKKSGICSEKNISKNDAVAYFERAISAIVMKAGLNLRSLLYKHRNVNFENPSEWIFSKHSNSNLTCPEIENNYYGSNIIPYEVIFYKNIRHPGAHRGEEISGIPKFIANYLSNIIEIKS